MRRQALAILRGGVLLAALAFGLAGGVTCFVVGVVAVGRAIVRWIGGAL